MRTLLSSTSGVEFQSQHTSTTIPASSTHTVTLSGIALETGTLTIRGCFVQLPGGLAREFILPLPPSASASSNPRISATPSLKISHSPYDAERIKFTGLESNHLLRPSDQPERSGSGTNSVIAPPRFLQYQVVPEQPLLRIRRSSIAHGSLMLYDGESYVFSQCPCFKKGDKLRSRVTNGLLCCTDPRFVSL